MALDRVAQVLRQCIVAHGVVLIGLVGASLIAAARLVPGLFGIMQNVGLGRYGGAGDAATAIIILFGLVNISALMVTTVSILAREGWSLPGLIFLMTANLLALIFWGYTPAIITIVFGALAGLQLARMRGALRTNPVMVRELRGRMRGARAFVVITIYLALMSGFALLLYIIVSSVNSASASAATGQIGRDLFAGVVGIELLLIIFIAPSFTAGAITGERERQTYDLVRATLLSTPSFITGKLESSLGYILLLLLAAIPLQSIAFLFGGVSETELLLAFIILTVTAITFGTFGIYFSATQPRTLAASVRTYGTIAGWAFVAPLVGAFVLGLLQASLFGSANAIQSPVIESILNYALLLVTSLNPFATAIGTQNLLVSQQQIGFYTVTLVSDGSTIPMVSPWILFTIIYQAIASVLIVLTIRRTRQIDVNA
jgi:hypothetical protein